MGSPTLYDDLILDQYASSEAIRAAYIALVKVHHPDAKGDPEKFRKVQRAYDTLSDPEKRKRYDETGEIAEGPDNIESLAKSMLIGVVMQLIDQISEPTKCDLIAAARDVINQAILKAKADTKQAEAVIANIEKIRKRFKGGSKVIELGLDQRVQQAKQATVQMERVINQSKRALELLKDYSFDVEKPRQVQSGFTRSGLSNTSTTGFSQW